MLRYHLRKKLHTSWLVAIASAGIVAGVISTQYIDQYLLSSISWLLTGLALCGLVAWHRAVWVIPLVLIAGLLIGLWRGSLGQIALEPYAELYGITLNIEGKVVEDVELDKRGSSVLRLADIVIAGHHIDGSLWATTQAAADIKRGDIVVVEGKLQPGFGSFAGAVFQAKLRGVQRPVPGDVARQVRDWFAAAVGQAVPEPESSLGLGYLVGQRRGLPPELDEALRIAGLTHIVVASGYNLTILVRFARRLFEKISKYLSALSASLMIAGFIAITGMSPSMSRAGLVAGLALAAWYYGRKFHPLVLLSFAAAVTLLVNPSYGWNDLGWQLSFAAFAGVMILAPLMQAYFFGNKKPGTVRQILGETIAAQIATAPIIILAFGQISLIAPLSNLLVLPLVPLAMVLTFIAGFGALIVSPIASLVGLPATWLLAYMVGVAEYLSTLPWALQDVVMTPLGAALCYGLIIGACLYMSRATQFRLRDSNIIE